MRSLESTYKTSATLSNKKSETNHTQKKQRKTASFCLDHPILQASPAQHQEKTLQSERVPLAGKKKEYGLRPASQSSLHKEKRRDI